MFLVYKKADQCGGRGKFAYAFTGPKTLRIQAFKIPEGMCNHQTLQSCPNIPK